MDTAEIMTVALAQAGLQEVHSGSGIHIVSTDLMRALFGVDIEVVELLYAKEAAFDVVVAHHPVGGGGASDHVTEVMWRQVRADTDVGIAEPVARATVAERVRAVHRRRHLVRLQTGCSTPPGLHADDGVIDVPRSASA